MEPVAYEFRLLGNFAVLVKGSALDGEVWRRRRAAELVKILTLADGRRLHREQLMDLMWPGRGPGSARANLRKAIHFARKALGSDASIRTRSELIELCPMSSVVVDCERFREAAEAALASSDVIEATQAGAMYVGDLLPDDRYAPWAHEPRERFRLLAIRVLKTAQQWQRVLELDQADEEAHRALMKEALDAGQRTAAIRQFERLRERLRIDLGMGPSSASLELYQRALSGRVEDPIDGPERTRALLATAFVQMNSGQLEDAKRSAEEAHSLSVRGGLVTEFNEATALLSLVSSLQGRWRTLFRSEFVDAVRRSPETAERVFDAHLCVTEYHVLGPDGHEGMLEFAHELRAIARSSGSVRGEAVSELLAGEAELFSGHLDRARQSLEIAVRLHDEAGAVGGEVLALQRLAECSVLMGERERAAGLLDECLDLIQSTSLAPHLISRIHEVKVKAAEGSAVQSAVLAGESALAGRLHCPPCSVGFQIATARALALLGEDERARKHLDRAEGIAAMWSGGVWHAAVLETRGHLAQTNGDGAMALELLNKAADLFADLGRVPDRDRCILAAEASRESSTA